MQRLSWRGENDHATVAHVAVMVYFTPAFREFVSDPWKCTPNLWCDPIRFIKRQIAFSNLVLEWNSIPIILELHCIEELTEFYETSSSTAKERLSMFSDSKTSLDSLLNSADIAVLMTGTPSDRGRVAGRANFGPPDETRDPPICWVFPKMEISLLHEIGHIFGCRHNREIHRGDPNSKDSNFGNLVKGTNVATIMAYPTKTHCKRVPYFSSRDIKCDGVRLGNAQEDNRKHIIQKRFLMSQRGNKSINCSHHNKSCEKRCKKNCCKSKGLILKEPDPLRPYSVNFCNRFKNNSQMDLIAKDCKAIVRKLKGIARIIILQGMKIEVGKEATEYFAHEFIEDGQPITVKILNRELKDYHEDEDGGVNLKIG